VEAKAEPPKPEPAMVRHKHSDELSRSTHHKKPAGKTVEKATKKAIAAAKHPAAKAPAVGKPVKKTKTPVQKKKT
jgi:hypothetical protein